MGGFLIEEDSLKDIHFQPASKLARCTLDDYLGVVEALESTIESTCVMNSWM